MSMSSGGSAVVGRLDGAPATRCGAQDPGAHVPRVRHVTWPGALYRLAAWCWWLTLAALTLNAGWDLHIAGAGGGAQIYWFDLPLLGTLAFWALALMIDPAPAPLLGPLVPPALLAGLAALALLSATVAYQLHLALAMGARLFLLLLFYLYTLNRVAGRGIGHVRARRLVAGALAAGLAVQGVVALGQTVRQASLGLGALGERAVNLRTSGDAVVELHGRHWLRAYGLTAHPNVLGGFVAASLLPIALWLPREVARVAVPCCLGLLLLTLSRGAALAALCSAAAYVASERRFRLPRPRLVVIGGLAVAGLLVLTPAGALVAARFNAADPLEQFSVSERLSSQSTAIGLIGAHPLLGVGADNYLAAVQARSGATGGDQAYVPVVHNAYLLAAAEVGPAGAALLAAALLWPAWRGLRLRRGLRLPTHCGGYPDGSATPIAVGWRHLRLRSHGSATPTAVGSDPWGGASQLRTDAPRPTASVSRPVRSVEPTAVGVALPSGYPPQWVGSRRPRQEARGDVAASGGLVACATLGLVDFYSWSLPAFTLLWGTLLAVWAAGDAA